MTKLLAKLWRSPGRGFAAWQDRRQAEVALNAADGTFTPAVVVALVNYGPIHADARSQEKLSPARTRTERASFLMQTGSNFFGRLLAITIAG